MSHLARHQVVQVSTMPLPWAVWIPAFGGSAYVRWRQLEGLRWGLRV